MRELDLDAENLVALHALLQERHVTRAAQRLGITQSSMSHRLKRLREAFQDPLLVRSAGALIPTARAASMAGPLADALRALREAIDTPEAFEPKRASFVLSVGMTDVLVPLVPGLVAELAKVAPKARLQVQRMPLSLGDALGKAEPMIVIAPEFFATSGTMLRKLGELEFGIAARRGHPALKKKLSREQWLAIGHVVVNTGNSAQNLIEEELRRAGLQRRIAVEVPTFLAALHVVARSEWILNGPLKLMRELAPTLNIATTRGPLPVSRVPFAMLWHERYQKDAAHRWARDFMLRAMRAVFDAR